MKETDILDVVHYIRTEANANDLKKIYEAAYKRNEEVVFEKKKTFQLAHARNQFRKEELIEAAHINYGEEICLELEKEGFIYKQGLHYKKVE